MRLSRQQGAALVMLVGNGPSSVYSLRSTLQTMWALERRKLVKPERRPGAFVFPHTSIIWHLTNAGRDWVNALPTDTP